MYVLAVSMSLQGSYAHVSYFGGADTFINSIPIYRATPSTSVELLFHLLRGAGPFSGAQLCECGANTCGEFKSLFMHGINAPVLEV